MLFTDRTALQVKKKISIQEFGVKNKFLVVGIPTKSLDQIQYYVYANPLQNYR